MPTLYQGKRGGKYYKKNGRKIYVKKKQSSFGWNDIRSFNGANSNTLKNAIKNIAKNIVDKVSKVKDNNTNQYVIKDTENSTRKDKLENIKLYLLDYITTKYTTKIGDILNSTKYSLSFLYDPNRTTIINTLYADILYYILVEITNRLYSEAQLLCADGKCDDLIKKFAFNFMNRIEKLKFGVIIDNMDLKKKIVPEIEEKFDELVPKAIENIAKNIVDKVSKVKDDTNQYVIKDTHKSIRKDKLENIKLKLLIDIPNWTYTVKVIELILYNNYNTKFTLSKGKITGVNKVYYNILSNLVEYEEQEQEEINCTKGDCDGLIKKFATEEKKIQNLIEKSSNKWYNFIYNPEFKSELVDNKISTIKGWYNFIYNPEFKSELVDNKISTIKGMNTLMENMIKIPIGEWPLLEWIEEFGDNELFGDNIVKTYKKIIRIIANATGVNNDKKNKFIKITNKAAEGGFGDFEGITNLIMKYMKKFMSPVFDKQKSINKIYAMIIYEMTNKDYKKNKSYAAEKWECEIKGLKKCSKTLRDLKKTINNDDYPDLSRQQLTYDGNLVYNTLITNEWFMIVEWIGDDGFVYSRRQDIPNPYMEYFSFDKINDDGKPRFHTIKDVDLINYAEKGNMNAETAIKDGILLDDLCIICQENFKKDDKVSTLLPCGHTFHYECIKNAHKPQVENNYTNYKKNDDFICNVCRKEIESAHFGTVML
jgi:hypothetical protein